MSKILLESGIIVLLVLMGISVFIPSGNNVNDVIVDFEDSVQSGEEVNDGEIIDVDISKEDDVNFVSRINCKIGNIIVDGLNSMFELGMKFIRVIVNWSFILLLKERFFCVNILVVEELLYEVD